MTASRREILAGAVAAGAAAAVPVRAAARTATVERWAVHEIELAGPAGGNPFDDVALAAVFSCDGARIRVNGFYDGDGMYRIRFSPSAMGRWTWVTTSNVAALDGKAGAFACVPPSPGNRGPVRMTPDGYHFVHADGTPFRPIGTTAYSWALQSDERCAQTLATLKANAFNKIRMCVFPNVASAVSDPFVRTSAAPGDWDATRFDPAYFRRFEDRIRRLGAIGVEADVILYHPYDKARGYSNMKRADDERYLRYVAARFGAYRNVWWAMANEYDLVESKTEADWDHLFETLVAADPHDRLRSIHNLHVYYDHRKPWITHASIQNGAAVLDDGRVHPHRLFARKAVVFDEVVYEGNSPLRWARLTGEQLVERFWWGTLGGAYVGHGEVLTSDADVSWLGQGGTLSGTSPPRLAFLARILAGVPSPGIDPIQQFWDYHLGGKAFGWYLKYFGRDTPREWRVALPGKAGDPHGRYRADIIDTWAMTITPVEGVFTMTPRDAYDWHDPARPTIALPDRPYQAIRLVRV